MFLEVNLTQIIHAGVPLVFCVSSDGLWKRAEGLQGCAGHVVVMGTHEPPWQRGRSLSPALLSATLSTYSPDLVDIAAH